MNEVEGEELCVMTEKNDLRQKLLLAQVTLVYMVNPM